MSDIDQSKANASEAGQAFWDTYRQMMERDGVNIGEVWANWLVRQYQWLAQTEARADFSELCEAGCAPFILASIVGMIRLSPRLNELWNTMVGSPYRREKMTQSLERAAATLEGLFKDVIAGEDENQRADFAKVGRLPPSLVVSEIRLWARCITLTEKVTEKVETRSLTELTRYLLAAYVKRATGNFCDRNVSGLLGEIAGSPNHNEVAQRMWRNRNFQRLDNHLSWILDPVFDLGSDGTHLK
jgi:hypothetical protein